MSIPELYTLDDLATEITEAYGSSTATDRSKAYRTVNRAIQIIAKKGRWPFFRVEDATFTTVSGTETYILPTNIKLVDYIHMRDPARKLRFIDLRTLRRKYPNNTTLTGTPLYWRTVNYDPSAEGYRIALWPIPDAAITMYYDADLNPNFLSDKSDDVRTIGIPDEMISTLINIATALMYEKYDNDMYTQKMAEAKQELDEDFYRMTNHPDDDLTSRQYSGAYDLRRDDPILPPQYGED